MGVGMQRAIGAGTILRASLAVALCGSTAFSRLAFAADLPSTDVAFEQPSLTGVKNPLTTRSREYVGVSLADWVLFPSVFAGVAYDDNVYNAGSFRRDDVAFRLRPSIVGERDNGIHKTLVYGTADARIYARQSSANVANARVGFSHYWEVQRDLTVRLQADYLRNRDVSNAGQIFTASGFAVAVQPITYNSLLGQATVQKSFGRLFTAIGGSIAMTLYEDTKTIYGASLAQGYRNVNVYQGSGRIGYWLTPAFYAFVEPTGNGRDYYNSPSFNSQGVRVVGGVGTDRIGLFRGEVYGGFYSQKYDSALFGTVTSPLFGGRIWYYPLEQLTIAAQVDQSATESTFISTVNPLGSVARTTTGQATATYSLSQLWSATVRGAVAYSAYTSTPRKDTLVTVGALVNYNIWRNLSATVEYQFATLSSNVAGVGYSKNLVSAGVTYRY